MSRKLENDLLVRALTRQPVPRTPVWLMRQAGRYLPEYREVRQRAGDFLTLCSTPELACEVTLQPLRRFALDAAILFADILLVPHAMGLGLHFVEGEGPRFRTPVRSRAAIRRLGVPDVEKELGYVLETVRLVRAELADRTPLIGFAGSPWTVATYMVEGGASRELEIISSLARDEPAQLERLLDVLARATTDYLNAQVAAGADVLMLFDTWGGMLPADDYLRFSLASMERILEGLEREHEGRRIPVILFTKDAGERLADMSESGCDALGVDWNTELARARELTADRVALQGNLDPAVLLRSPEEIEAGVARVLESYGRGPGHVFNLGHGVTPDVDPEHVRVMVDAVHRLSPAYHA